MTFVTSALGKIKTLDPVWVITLLALTVFSGFAYLYQLAHGQISEFYGAIAMSMSKSLSNFWFGASDPGGTITLDKIPGSYWIPAIFVKVFGFSTWSVNAPNALASMGLVLVAANTGKRLGGRTAGLIAGAIAATTPILAAVARSNQPESFLLLTLAIASYFAVRAVQDSSFKHLMFAGIWIAVAFHTYMLVAWALWPALGVAYLFTRGGFRAEFGKKVAHVLAAGLTSLALSFVWIISVMLTPAANRPYIGGSNGNSAVEMVFGYNGLGRFSDLTSGTTIASSVRSFTPPFSGSPGLFRLLNNELLPQIGWLVPASLIAVVILIAIRKFQATGIFLGLYFLVYAAMFSVVAGMHQFYTAALAVPMGLLIGYAFTQAAKTKSVWAQVLLVAVTLVTALYIGVNYLDYFVWAPAVQLVLAIAAVVVILLGLTGKAKVLTPILVAGALVFSPAVWALDTYNHPSSINPLAGATSGGFGGGMPSGMAGGLPGGAGAGSGAGGFPAGGPASGGSSMGAIGQAGTAADKAFVKYLEANRHGAKFLLTVFGTMTAAHYINGTGENILPIGGFDGSDPSPTLAQIKKYVSAGDIRYVLVSGQAGGGGLGAGQTGNNASAGQTNSAAIQSWVQAHCSPDSYSSSLFLCTASSVD